jgi:hypothetical protein
VVDARPPHDAVRWRGEPISRAWSASGAYHHRIHGFTRSMRPRDGTSLLGLVATRARSGDSLGRRLAAPAKLRVVKPHAVQRHGELAGERHLGFLHARGVATRMARALRCDQSAARVSRVLAASYSATRTAAAPTLLIRPVRSTSPDWYLRCARPKWAPTALEC